MNLKISRVSERAWNSKTHFRYFCPPRVVFKLRISFPCSLLKFAWETLKKPWRVELPTELKNLIGCSKKSKSRVDRWQVFKVCKSRRRVHTWPSIRTRSASSVVSPSLAMNSTFLPVFIRFTDSVSFSLCKHMRLPANFSKVLLSK